MRIALLAVLAVAIPVAASAAPPRFPGEERMEPTRQRHHQAETRLKEHYKSETTNVRHEKMPEAVKNMLKYDLCSSASARCD